MARRKFKWDLSLYGSAAKNEIMKHAHLYGADLQHGDKAFMLFKSDKMSRTEISPVTFWRRTNTGFYAEVTTNNGDLVTAYWKYSKGYMIYANESDAMLQHMLHAVSKYAKAQSEADIWKEEMETLVKQINSRETKW